MRLSKISAFLFITTLIIANLGNYNFENAKAENITADWNVITDEVSENKEIVLAGDLIINDGGNLTLKNTTLKINSAKDGEYGIYVNSGGEIHILNSKIISTNQNHNSTNQYSFNFLVSNDTTFEMRNSELSNCGYESGKDGRGGLSIYTNNTIIENSVFHDNYIGFNLYSSTNHTIENNIVYDNLGGIYFLSSNDNIIKNNKIYNNVNDGIKLQYSNENVIENNEIHENDYGIDLINSNNNTIERNIVYKNTHGIYLSYSNYNKVGDRVYDNDNFGISCVNSDNTKIMNANIYSNEKYGTYFSDSDGVIENSTISASAYSDYSYYDIYLGKSSQITTINTTFNQNDVYLSGSSSKLTVKNYLWVEVLDDNDLPIENADVKISFEKNNYYWIDIDYNGTYIGNGDDEIYNDFPIGFNFPFFGNTYDKFHVSTNGFISFDSLNNSYSDNVEIPNKNSPNNIVAVFWDDLVIGSSGGMYYKTYGKSSNKYTVIEWYNVDRYDSNGYSKATFEVILYENGEIKFQYSDVYFGNSNYNYGNSATVGFENSDGTKGTQYLYNEAKLSSYLAIEYKTNEESNLTFKTDKNGKTPQILLTDRVYDGSSSSTPSTINLFVSYGNYGFRNNPRIVDMSGSHTETFKPKNEVYWDEKTVYGNEEYVNKTIVSNNDIIVEDGGTLILRNVDLEMNSTSYSSPYKIEVKNGGKLYIYDYDNNPKTKNDRSNITSHDEYNNFIFIIDDGAVFEMKNSELSRCGSNYYYSYDYENYGLAIKTDNAIIENNTFYNNYYNIIPYYSENNKIKNNTFYIGSYNGIYLYYSDNNEIENNLIYGVSRSSSDYGIYGYYSDYNKITSNVIYNIDRGLYLSTSTENNEIKNNIFYENNYGIYAYSDYSSSQRYNKIEGNIFYDNHYSDIYLTSSSYNEIIGNKINTTYDYYSSSYSYEDHYGIYLSSSSSYNIISNNNVANEENGIFISSGYNNTIENNNVHGCKNGVYLTSSTVNKISENIILNNNFGIQFRYSSDDNKLMNNNISLNNDYGIYIDDSSNIEITCNHIYDNGRNSIGAGIYLTASSNSNKITYNNINNNYYGIEFSYSTYSNRVNKNNYINNTIQAYFPSGSVNFDYENIGNYWNDYNGTDTNNDGIGDTPYKILGGGNKKDNYPLMKPFEFSNSIPIVKINFPKNNTIVKGEITISGIASDSDGDVLKVEIKIDNNTWQNAYDTSLWYYYFDTTTISNGNHTIYARTYDGFNYSSIDEVVIFVNQSYNFPPEISYFYSSKYKVKIGEDVKFTTIADDYDGEVKEYYYDFGDGNNSGWTDSSYIYHNYEKEGNYIIKVKVRDDKGTESNYSLTSVSIVKDTVSKPKEEGLNHYLLILIAVIIISIILTLILLMRKKGNPAVQQIQIPRQQNISKPENPMNVSQNMQNNFNQNVQRVEGNSNYHEFQIPRQQNTSEQNVQNQSYQQIPIKAFVCPKCSAELRVKEGERVECWRCGNKLQL